MEDIVKNDCKNRSREESVLRDLLKDFKNDTTVENRMSILLAAEGVLNLFSKTKEENHEMDYLHKYAFLNRIAAHIITESEENVFYSENIINKILEILAHLVYTHENLRKVIINSYPILKVVKIGLDSYRRIYPNLTNDYKIDPLFHSNVKYAARFVTYIVNNDSSAQQKMLEENILKSLINSISFFGEKYLTFNEIPQESYLLKSWESMCYALTHCVDYPYHNLNQRTVYLRIIEKYTSDEESFENSLEMKMSKPLTWLLKKFLSSLEEISDSYLIPLLSLMKALLSQNEILKMYFLHNQNVIPLISDSIIAHLPKENCTKIINKLCEFLSILISFINSAEIEIEGLDFKSVKNGELVINLLKFLELENDCIHILLLLANLIHTKENLLAYLQSSYKSNLLHIFSSSAKVPIEVVNAAKFIIDLANTQKKAMKRTKREFSYCDLIERRNTVSHANKRPRLSIEIERPFTEDENALSLYEDRSMESEQFIRQIIKSELEGLTIAIKHEQAGQIEQKNGLSKLAETIIRGIFRALRWLIFDD